MSSRVFICLMRLFYVCFLGRWNLQRYFSRTVRFHLYFFSFFCVLPWPERDRTEPHHTDSKRARSFRSSRRSYRCIPNCCFRGLCRLCDRCFVPSDRVSNRNVFVPCARAMFLLGSFSSPPRWVFRAPPSLL